MSFAAPRLLAVFFGVFIFVGVILGLPGGTAYAENPSGTGSCSSNSAPAGVPVTQAATSITSSSGVLNGSVPGGTCPDRNGPNYGYFRYSTVSSTACTSGVSVGSVAGPATASITITSLLPSTTYYFCEHISNNWGDKAGSLLNFTTLNIAPAVVTGSETNVTATGATLNGTVDPNGDLTTYYYRYSTVNGVCSGFGNVTAWTGGNAGSGQSPVSFPKAITGLTVNTTYYYCLVGLNSAGTRYGAVGSLFTSAGLPVMTTSVAISITSSSATIQGAVMPNNQTTSVWFRYSPVVTTVCDDVFGTRTTIVPGYTTMTTQAYNAPLSGLTENTDYYYCAIGHNVAGFGKGAIFKFRTIGRPDTNSGSSDPVTTTTATLNGTINPNGSATNAFFRYATSTSPAGGCLNNFGSYTPVLGYGSGTADVNIAANLVGLSPNTTYYYCLLAYNQGGVAAGWNYGTIYNFTTPPLNPIVTTNPATSITYSAGTLNGTINPQGTPADIWYRWGPTNTGDCNTLPTYTTPGVSSAGSSNEAIPPFALSSLSPSTTYYFCAFGYNDAGLDVAGIMRSFTTSAPPPPQCADGIDNDSDGFIDLADSGCTNAADTTEAIATTMSLTASPTRVRTGGTTTFTYDTGGRTLCSITGTNGNTSGLLAATTGTFVSSAIAQVATYTLSCSGDSARAQAVIQRVPSVQEI